MTTPQNMPFTDSRAQSQLPTTNQPWPPVRFNPVNHSQREWSAWWSGDPDQLMRAYYSLGANSALGRQYFATTGESGTSAVRPGQFRGGLLGSVRRFFWGQPTPSGEKRTNYHVPLAGDLAATSASLLYAQPPTLTADDGDTTVQEYLETLIDDGTHATLLEGAECGAAMGGHFLRVVWNTAVSDKPWIDVVPPDAAVPEFIHGKLVGVTFWTVLRDEGKDVVRHLEKHLPGQGAILHGVYHGNQQDLGRQMALTDFPELAHIAASVTDGDAITLPNMPGDVSTVVYVPNMRPNRLWRDLGPSVAPLGRSDYAGIESLMDGLDEAFSSWMRDIRLGKARLIVPHSYIDNVGRGKGGVFEPDREVFTPINMLVTGESGQGNGIMPQQFDIRWQAHQQTCNAFIEQIIGMAGYSGQTLGLQGDIAQTATEVTARERKSLTTRGKKINYHRPPLRDILYAQMAISRTVFGRTDITPLRPDVEFPDVVLPNQNELATTVATMRGAETISIETAVATLHPDWDTEDVAEEVARIEQEMGVDMLSKARVMVQGPPTDSLEDQLGAIPAAIGAGTVEQTIEQGGLPGGDHSG